MLEQLRQSTGRSMRCVFWLFNVMFCECVTHLGLWRSWPVRDFQFKVQAQVDCLRTILAHRVKFVCVEAHWLQWFRSTINGASASGLRFEMVTSASSIAQLRRRQPAHGGLTYAYTRRSLQQLFSDICTVAAQAYSGQWRRLTVCQTTAALPRRGHGRLDDDALDGANMDVPGLSTTLLRSLTATHTHKDPRRTWRQARCKRRPHDTAEINSALRPHVKIQV